MFNPVCGISWNENSGKDGSGRAKADIEAAGSPGTAGKTDIAPGAETAKVRRFAGIFDVCLCRCEWQRIFELLFKAVLSFHFQNGSDGIRYMGGDYARNAEQQ